MVTLAGLTLAAALAVAFMLVMLRRARHRILRRAMLARIVERVRPAVSRS